MYNAAQNKKWNKKGLPFTVYFFTKVATSGR